MWPWLRHPDNHSTLLLEDNAGTSCASMIRVPAHKTFYPRVGLKHKGTKELADYS